MRPIFQSPSVTDEMLIREMNTAVTAESERISKFVARKRSVRTAQTAPIAASDAPQETRPSKSKEQNASKPNPLIASLEEVKADIAMIKQSINVNSKKRMFQGDQIGLSLHVKIALTSTNMLSVSTVSSVALLSTTPEAVKNGNHGETGGSCMHGTECSCE